VNTATEQVIYIVVSFKIELSTFTPFSQSSDQKAVDTNSV